MEAPVLMNYDKHKRATEITVGTVAPLEVVDAVVELATAGHVANEVSLVASYPISLPGTYIYHPSL